MTERRISVVLPVYNEAGNIRKCLAGLYEALHTEDHEIIVCYDFEGDDTLPAIEAMEDKPPTVRLVKNDLGKGVAYALRAGFAAAAGDVIVTTMADLSDPPEVIPEMARKVREEGAAVVSGSRYMKGGSQTGGPLLKGILSRLAGLSLYWIAGLGTRDATTNFRAYSREFLARFPPESCEGFDLALELTVKAHLNDLKIAEVPSSWVDRTSGSSRFRLINWLPKYLHWYGKAMAEPILVWTTTILLMIALFSFMRNYIWRIPYWDEWEHVPVLVGQKPLNFEWLWAQHNEHRIPIPKIVYMAVTRIVGDFSAAPSFNAFLMAAITVAGLLFLRKGRGRTVYSDVLLPFLFLNFGHAENLLWGFQLGFTIPAAILCLYILHIGCIKKPFSYLFIIWMGLASLCLAFCGANGIALVPAIALWFLIEGGGNILNAKSRRLKSSMLFLFFSVVLSGSIALYFKGFSAVPNHPKYAGMYSVFRGLFEFTGISFGPSSPELQPWISCWATILVLVSFSACLVFAVTQKAERSRFLGLLFSFLALFSLALGLSYGRSGFGPGGCAAERYFALAAPLVLLMYVLWNLRARSVIGSVFITVLITTVAILFGSNTYLGRRTAQTHHKIYSAFINDFYSGMNLSDLTNIHAKYWFPDPDLMKKRIEMLDAVKFGIFSMTEEEKVRRRFESMRPQFNKVFKRDPSWYCKNCAFVTLEESCQALQVHPPGEVRFDLESGSYILTGKYGILPKAYLEGKTDGAKFVFTVSENCSEKLIFEKTLRPLVEEADRGSHDLKVLFELKTQGKLILRTCQLETPYWDWAYVTKIDIQKKD